MKTTTDQGVSVFGLKKSVNPSTMQYDKWSGRARIVEGNPYHDQRLAWDLNGNAIDHQYGNINPQNIKRANQ